MSNKVRLIPFASTSSAFAFATAMLHPFCWNLASECFGVLRLPATSLYLNVCVLIFVKLSRWISVLIAFFWIPLQLIEQTLENNGHDLDLAIKSLNDLRLGCAGNVLGTTDSSSATHSQPSNQPQGIHNYMVPCLAVAMFSYNDIMLYFMSFCKF